VEEIHSIGFLSKLLETKLMQVLRFKHGQVFAVQTLFMRLFLWLSFSSYHYVQIYSTGVTVFLGGNRPSRTGDVRGDISINFSCDPEISLKLVISISILFLAFARSIRLMP